MAEEVLVLGGGVSASVEFFDAAYFYLRVPVPNILITLTPLTPLHLELILPHKLPIYLPLLPKRFNIDHILSLFPREELLECLLLVVRV